MLRGLPNNVAVKTTAKSPVARHDQHLNTSAFALLQEGMCRAVDSPAEVAEDAAHFMRVRTSGQNPILRSFELGRGYHLHSLRNLLRILEGRNFAP